MFFAWLPGQLSRCSHWSHAKQCRTQKRSKADMLLEVVVRLTLSTFTYILVYVLYIYAHVYTYIQLYLHIYICVYIYMIIFTYIHIHQDQCIYMYLWLVKEKHCPNAQGLSASLASLAATLALPMSSSRSS